MKQLCTFAVCCLLHTSGPSAAGINPLAPTIKGPTYKTWVVEYINDTTTKWMREIEFADIKLCTVIYNAERQQVDILAHPVWLEERIGVHALSRFTIKLHEIQYGANGGIKYHITFNPANKSLEDVLAPCGLPFEVDDLLRGIPIETTNQP